MTYDCDICHGVNSANKLHCQYCGTIPADYSVLRKPSRIIIRDTWIQSRLGDYIPAEPVSSYIQVLVAFGAMRQTSHRTIKRVFRTVKPDYYATE